MTVRRGLPYLLAIVLGVGAALLAACGGGTKSGIPSAYAGELKSQIEDVRQATDDGRCSQVPDQLKQVDDSIDALPQSTDEQLVSALRDGADKLRQAAVDACDSTPTETTTTETTPTETTTHADRHDDRHDDDADRRRRRTRRPSRHRRRRSTTRRRRSRRRCPSPSPPPPPATPGGGTPPEITQP